MGGKLKKGNCVVGGVVTTKVRVALDKLVVKEGFRSRSESIGYILTEVAEGRKVKF